MSTATSRRRRQGRLFVFKGSKLPPRSQQRAATTLPAHKEPFPVPVNTKAIGKTYEPTTYAVGREKIKEYARAVGETNPIHLDVQAAREAGYDDVVAPPMF